MAKKKLRNRNQVKVLPKGKNPFNINGLRRFLPPMLLAATEKPVAAKSIGR